MDSQPLILPADLERETGISIDVVRKWRSRYGFPVTLSVGGRIGYTREQAVQLKLIGRLLDGGFRPAQVVGKSLAELERLSAVLAASACDVQWTPLTRQAIGLLRAGDIDALENLLRGALQQNGIGAFARDTVAPIAMALGEAWAQGEIEVFQEHLCTSLMSQLLQAAIIEAVPLAPDFRVLLATPPEEMHTLGILMVQAVLAEAGVRCVLLGPNVPLAELPKAVQACGAGVLALSFSFAYPARRIVPLILDLRKRLDPAVAIWIGGAGLQAIRVPECANLLVFSDLELPVAELLPPPAAAGKSSGGQGLQAVAQHPDG